MFYLTDHGKQAHHWPLPTYIVQRMLASNSPLAELATLSEVDCRERLRAQWAALTSPENRAIADLILSFPSMCIVEGGKEGFRLALYSNKNVLSITALEHNVPTEQLKFPFADIPGLLEFLKYFSGLMDFGNFVTAGSIRVMWDADYDKWWGPVELWDGSLVIYEMPSGNVIVIRPDGAIGKWEHEYAAPMTLEEYRDHFADPMPGYEDGPVKRLKYDFAGLLKNYAQYCQRDIDGEVEEDIFYS